MASSVTRDHHNLTRNLKLNGNYLTNDGGTEGISINDDGNVTVTGTSGSGDAYLYIRPSVSQQCYLKMGSAGYEDYAQIQVDHSATGDMAFWTANTEKLRIRGNGNVGIGTSTPISKLEILNTNVQYSTGTAIQADATIAGSGTTFTADMVGGRFIFDDGTDAGVVIGFTNTNVLTVSTSQTVGSSPSDFRSYKIYYPSVQVDTSGNSSSLKIGNMTIDNDEIDLGTSGSITIDAGDDIALSADGGNITMNDGSTTVFDFDVDNVSLKIMDDADTGDYCSIAVGANGATTITTVDDDGASANFSINTDGAIVLAPTTWSTDNYIALQGYGTYINPITKHASGTNDTSLLISEVLNLASGAGGTDVHYGIKYSQTQTDLTGWDSVYLMYLTGGDAARTFAIKGDGKVGIGVADPASPLEIFSTSSQLKISYDASNYADISVASDGHLEIATTGTDADLTLDSASGIMLETANLYVYPSGASANSLVFSSGPPKLTINSENDDGDEFSIQVNAAGATTITTIDDDAAAAHLTITPDGHVKFDGCGVGFTRHEETFSTTDLKSTGGTDDTDIDFRVSNKIRLEMTGDIAQMNLVFPAVSGNFVMVCTTNGDHDVTAWKVWESDLSAATTTDVMWAGGSVPAFTNNGIDIVSFYWDATEQQCYGVASLAFATP